MIAEYPKIFTVGSTYVRDILQYDVEITEKVDGSFFSFGKIDDRLYMRSKGAELFTKAPQQMFLEGVEYVSSIEDKIPNNTIYSCEYLRTPKHNVLEYSKVPRNHLALFSVSHPDGSFIQNWFEMTDHANFLGIDIVELMAPSGRFTMEQLDTMLERDSFLGGTKIEGIVIKLYVPMLIGGRIFPITCAKLVSSRFREVASDWRKTHTTRGSWETFVESFRTEARWEKSVQRRRDNGELLNAPQDIGPLLKSIQEDVEAEEEEDIKEYLWHHFKSDLLRRSVAGFPQWYKERLNVDTGIGNT